MTKTIFKFVIIIITVVVSIRCVHAQQDSFLEELRGELNRIRQSYGLSIIQRDEKLVHLAKWYSDLCAYHMVISHDLATPEDFIDALGRKGNIYFNVHEALYKGPSPPNPKNVITLFMNSPEHRKVLLATADHMGVAYSVRNDTCYLTLYVGDAYDK